VRSSHLERKLVLGVLTLFLIPTVAVGAGLFVLYRNGTLADPATLALAVLLGLVAMMTYLGLVAHGIGRVLVRSLQEIQLGTELMATVNPDHRLEVRTGDELQALAEEINRMADRLREAHQGLEGEVARATAALGIERETLSAVVASLGEGAVVVTAEGRVTLANRMAEELLGAATGGLLGRSLFDFVDREKVTHFLQRLGDRAGAAERFSLHPRSGAVLETVMTPFFDGPGRMIGVVLVLRDVTRTVRSDDERRRGLTEAVQALRGPLASVRSLSETLVADPDLGGGPARPLLQAIHAEALRLSGLVREMSEPARLGLTRPPWHFEEIAFTELAAMAIRRLSERDAAAAAVEVEEPSPVPRLWAEGSALSSALAHLLRTLRTREAAGGRAWLRARARGPVLQLEVGGEGGGRVAELEAALDEPVALGVATPLSAREIIRQHAGEVWAYVDGARMGLRVTLPAIEPGMAPPDLTADGTRPIGLVGAGLASGAAGAEPAPERPEFYDFTLFEEMDRHLAPASRARRLDQLLCVVLDVETTGLDPLRGDRIVSLAAVRVRGGVVKRGEVFDALVNPGRPIPPASTRFHGITDERVADAPPIGVVLPAFLRFADGAALVGHQVWFDLQCLAAEVARLGLPPLTVSHPVLDTLALSEVVHGPFPGHGLEAIAARLGAPVRGRHSALGDVLATAEIYVRLVELLRKRGIVTLGEAVDASRRARSERPDPAAAPGTAP
jgi:DNA polymerase-3 subunit epsilon